MSYPQDPNSPYGGDQSAYGQAYGQPYGQPVPGQPYGQPYGQPGYGAMPGYPAAPMAGKPDNNLVWAILATVVCCLPLGIVSIVKSTSVDKLWALGDFAGAQRAADEAKKWAMWSAIIGALWIVAVFAFWIIMVITSAASINHSYTPTYTTYSTY